MEKNNDKPKLRFPGFTDPWEQRELSKMANYRNGKAHENDISENGKYVVINSKFVSSDGKVRKYSIRQIEPLFKNEIAFVLSDVPNGRAIARTFLVEKDDKYTLNQRIAGITPLLNTEPYYLYILMNRNHYFLQFDDGAKQTNLSKIDVEKYLDYYPSKEEQAKIGAFFKELDNLITLHQRKLNHLQDKKKSLLQKMFPKNGEDSPELRFPGFTDDWEKRKLGEIAERVTYKNTKLESTLPLTISAQYGLVDQISFFNKRVASRDISGYYLLRKGEFAYNKSYSEGYPWGAVKRLERYEKGVLSTLYICFKLVNVNSDFLVSYYETNNWYKEVAKRASEGARNHGLLNIAADDFFDTELAIPSLKEEQAIIGSFFQNLNNLIILHQRKLNHLQGQKKSLLQQMFI